VSKATFVRIDISGRKNEMCKVYGYCRISTAKQSIDRQIRNIRAEYPGAVIVQEVFTGTKFQGRKELEKLLKQLQPGDTVVFDSVSRMSRNAEEGAALYEHLFNLGVHLVFLKESYVDSDTYRKAMEQQVQIKLDTGNQATDDLVGNILDALNRYTLELAKQQIKLAFNQAEKEVQDLHQRTREGIETARLNGKQIGHPQGAKLNVKKAAPAKELIKKHSKTFGGNLSDAECMKLAGVARNTYYKYKRELAEEAE
jgi:DNA invertase Pin-like site-specific DNA recombinase